MVDGEGNEHKDDSQVEPMVGLYMFKNAGELVFVPLIGGLSLGEERLETLLCYVKAWFVSSGSLQLPLSRPCGFHRLTVKLWNRAS